ncbi:MAG TPA: hypothetical protein DGB72_08615 [Gemmatimonadetes bacterium]|nr:hypothetical protein [Gemmatimonadota bacterium]
MIIDTEPPDPPKRRWPFLFAWSLAAMTTVLALFLTHTPASQQASVAVSASQAPSTSASVSRSVIVQQQQVSAGPTYVTRQRVDLSAPGAIVLSAPGAILPSAAGAIVYLDYAGHRIAVGPNDNLLTKGAPDSQTTGLR